MTLPATIALTRAEDGTLTGEICIGLARWTVTRWRTGADKGHIMFDAEEVADPEFVALMDKLVRKVAG